MHKVIQTKPEPYCPDCGGRMKLRRPVKSQTWDPFWGCTEYPECKGSRNIQEDGRPETDRYRQSGGLDE